MPPNAAFQLQIYISNCSHAENDDPVAFKVDGQRFEGGARTLKFAINSKYKVQLITKPAVEFDSLHLAGADLRPIADGRKAGEYSSIWDTSGVDVSKKGTREPINFTLQGSCGLLKRQIQCKFYQKENSHAEWGHKLKNLEWACAADQSGNITVTEENYK